MYNRAFRDFAAEVEERSGGEVTFEAHDSASLMPGNEMLAGIGRGTADMERLITTYFSRELPAGNWLLDLGATLGGIASPSSFASRSSPSPAPSS